MKKLVLALAVLSIATGCAPDLLALARAQAGAAAGPGATASPAPGSTASPAPGATAQPSGGSAVSGAFMTNAELDALIACANTKGPTGAALAQAWTTLKSTPEANRAYAAFDAVITAQAKAIGCR